MLETIGLAGMVAGKSATDLAQKNTMRQGAGEAAVLLVQYAAATVFVGVLVVLVGPMVFTGKEAWRVSPEFWMALPFAAVLNGLAMHFSNRAFKLSDASLVAPITLLTPTMLLVTSWVMLGQRVSVAGAVGVLLIVCGTYVMELRLDILRERDFLRPLRSLVSDKGVQYAFVTASIWSVTSNIDKIGSEASSPLLWVGSQSLLIVSALLVYRVLALRRAVEGKALWAIAPGCANAFTSVMQMYALTAFMVPYVIAVKRMSVLLTIPLSGVLFKEQHVGWRLLGAATMVAGAVLVLVYG